MAWPGTNVPWHATWLARVIGPGQCLGPGPMSGTGPGPMTLSNGPGPMSIIGPGLNWARDQCGFPQSTYDSFSTSDQGHSDNRFCFKTLSLKYLKHLDPQC